MLRPDGEPVEGETIIVTDDDYLRKIDRPVVREGRLPKAANEIFASAAGQRELGVGVGETVDLLIIPEIDVASADRLPPDVLERAVRGEYGQVRTFRLVGVGFTVGQVTQPDNASFLFTHALDKETHAGPIYTGFSTQLAEGERGVPAFVSAVNALAPGEPISFQTASSARRGGAGLRPQVVALAIFAIVMLVAAFATWLQAAGRRQRLAREEDRILVVLGMSRASRLAIDLLRSALVAVLAAAIAVAFAAAASSFLPLSEAYRIEPHRGFDIDVPVVTIGALLVVAVAIAIGCSVSLVSVHSRQRPSRLNRAVQRRIRWPTASIGVSHALEPGPGATAVPSRSTLISACVGVVCVVAAATFAAGLSQFVATPRSYGWDFDLSLSAGEGSDEEGLAVFDAVKETTADHPDVDGWGTVLVLQALVDGRPENVMGMRQGGGSSVQPTIIEGRAPSSGEVALGVKTLRRLHKSIGDRVDIGAKGAAMRFTVVGTTVLPPIGSNSADAAVLGGGALLPMDGLVRALRIAADTQGSRVIVDLAPGADAETFVDQTKDAVATSDLAGTVSAVGPELPERPGEPIAPSEVIAYRTVRSTPVVLAIVLSILAAATVGHALALSVHRRRRAFGILRALGFTGSQVRSTVAWHATTVAVIASLVGIPLGVIAGRAAWSLVADQLGVVHTSVVPWLVVALTAPVAVLAANVIAALPAHRAARMSTIEALRDERPAPPTGAPDIRHLVRTRDGGLASE